jgi:hypothetical protein
VLSIRDFAMPEPDFYGVIYKYGYTTDRLNDSGGTKLNRSPAALALSSTERRGLRAAPDPGIQDPNKAATLIQLSCD